MSAQAEDETGSAATASLLVVTGMSGGGKSVALNTFEDLGFYCVDNLPAELLPEFVRSAGHPGRVEQKLAVGIDMRNRGDLARVPEWLSAVGAMGLEPKLVFFDAADATLLRRYAETRRRHPLTHLGLALADAIARAHGGTLALGTAAGGGLEVEIRLPVQWPSSGGSGGTDKPNMRQ